MYNVICCFFYHYFQTTSKVQGKNNKYPWSDESGLTSTSATFPALEEHREHREHWCLRSPFLPHSLHASHPACRYRDLQSIPALPFTDCFSSLCCFCVLCVWTMPVSTGATPQAQRTTFRNHSFHLGSRNHTQVVRSMAASLFPMEPNHQT